MEFIKNLEIDLESELITFEQDGNVIKIDVSDAVKIGQKAMLLRSAKFIQDNYEADEKQAISTAEEIIYAILEHREYGDLYEKIEQRVIEDSGLESRIC